MKYKRRRTYPIIPLALLMIVGIVAVIVLFCAGSDETPEESNILKLTSYGSEITVVAEEVPEASGYQIRFSDDSTMENCKKKSSKTNSITLNVTKHGTYYVQVRTYTGEKGNRVYSSWSDVNTIIGRITIAATWKLNEKFIKALEDAGAYDIEIVGTDVDPDDYDGLFVRGGQDITPELYGEEENGSENCDYERDVTELAVINKFIDAGKPVLGVCRGMQLMNIAFGGTLTQDIGESHRDGDGVGIERRDYSVEGTLMYDLYGASTKVFCMHHQAIDQLGDGLVVTQWSEEDDTGIIEAYVHETKPCIAVQWHPEFMSAQYQVVYQYFVQTMAGRGIYRPFTEQESED